MSGSFDSIRTSKADQFAKDGNQILPASLICLNVPKNAAVYILLTAEGDVMSNEFYSVVDLPPVQFCQAYPLIQVSGADLTLDQWSAYAKNLHDRPDNEGGILSVLSEDGYIHALAMYELCARCAEARVMEVEHFCYLDLLNSSVGPLLIRALEERGRRFNCSEVRVRTSQILGTSGPTISPTVTAMFQRFGYATESDHLGKQFG